MQKNGTYEAAYEQRAERYPGLPQDAINEEVAAQYFGVVFSSESNIRKVIENSSQQELSMWQKIVEHLKEFVKKIKDAIERYAVEDKTVRAALKADADIIEELARQFDVCLKEAAKNKKPAEQVQGGEKQSRRIFREYTNKEIENWKNAKRIILYENDSQFGDFIHKSRVDNTFNKKIYFGAISEEHAKEIKQKTGIDVYGFNCSLASNEIRKIFKDHGNEEKEQLKGQRAINEEDF